MPELTVATDAEGLDDFGDAACTCVDREGGLAIHAREATYILRGWGQTDRYAVRSPE